MGKFKSGDKARVVYGHVIWTTDENYDPAQATFLGVANGLRMYDIQPGRVGQTIEVIGTYKDMYKNGSDSEYAVRFEDGQIIPWFTDDQLEGLEDEKV